MSTYLVLTKGMLAPPGEYCTVVAKKERETEVNVTSTYTKRIQNSCSAWPKVEYTISTAPDILHHLHTEKEGLSNTSFVAAGCNFVPTCHNNKMCSNNHIHAAY